MLKSHIKLLNEQAEELFKQSKKSSRSKEKLAYIEQARLLLKEAREILTTQRKQSILCYFEQMLLISKQTSYADYLEFCARNGLTTLSEKDYTDLVESIRNEL